MHQTALAERTCAGRCADRAFVIHLPTAPWLHYVGDMGAWIAAFLGGRWVYAHEQDKVERLARQTAPSYFVSLAIGAAAGAWAIGSLNTLRDAHPAISHSIAGALAGAIVAVEVWKLLNGVSRSTGGPFVIPLAAGIVVGRIGCLFAGLSDQTFGVATRLPWAVDLGDGIDRHPVQLYESLAMALFLAVYWRALIKRRSWAIRHGFHLFVLAYAGQRFAWEFLKPYPPVFGRLNLFHLVMIGLGLYALLWIAHDRRESAAA